MQCTYIFSGGVSDCRNSCKIQSQIRRKSIPLTHTFFLCLTPNQQIRRRSPEHVIIVGCCQIFMRDLCGGKKRGGGVKSILNQMDLHVSRLLYVTFYWTYFLSYIINMCIYYHFLSKNVQETFEYTKGVIRSRK